jgi:tetratricopeptide (TPR) repeat protein
MSKAVKAGIYVLLLTVVVLSGCEYVNKVNPFADDNKQDEVTVTPSEIEKQNLLEKLDKDFENADAHYKLGRLYQNDGLYSKAQYQYNLALSFDPVHRDAQAGMVKTLMKIGDKEKAELTADMYISQTSSSAQGSLLLALAFQKQELDDYAVRCYKQALRLAPDSAKINRQIGYYYLTRDNQTEAKHYLKRSFQINPNQPDVARQLGELGVEVKTPGRHQENVKKLDHAIEEYERELQREQAKQNQNSE